MSQTAPAINARRRRGTPQQWPVATSLDDPTLGLSFGELTDLWEPFGILPGGWDETMAAELRAAVHRIASLAVGEMSGKRTRWSTVASALALTMLTDVDLAELSDEERAACGLTDAPAHGRGRARKDAAAAQEQPSWNGESPFEAADELSTIQDLKMGWGTGPGALRLLLTTNATTGVALPAAGDPTASRRRRRKNGETAHVEPERWTPVGDGGEALDRLWSRWRRHRTLPVEVCASFMTPLRSLDLGDRGDDTPETLVIPSLWQVLATMLVEGPARARQRLLRHVEHEIRRDVRPRSDRPAGGRLSEGSLANRVQGVEFWMKYAHAIWREHREVLWAWRSPIDVDVDLSQATQWVADRRAVPLPVYRRARHELKSKLDARRRGGRLHLDDHVFYAWRDLMLLCLAGETGARAGELAELGPGSFEKRDLDGVLVPVVLIKPLKQGRRKAKRRGRRHGELRPQTMSDETYRLVREWVELFELSRDDTRSIWLSRKDGTARLSAGGLSRRLSGAKDGTKAVLPRLDGNGGYSLHCVRHLVETLAFSVGSGWLAANQSWQERISAQVFAAAKTIHAMPHDAHGYKDYEANADLWQHRTAVGDPGQGIAGLLDAVGGDAGARRGWDVHAIRTAHWALQRTQQELDDSNATLADLRLRRTELAKRRLPGTREDVPHLAERSLPQGDALVALVKDLHAKLDLLASRDVAREQRDADRDALDLAIEAAHERHAAAIPAHRAGLAKIEALRGAGRTFPLPDSAPTADELRRDHELAGREGPAPLPLDQESWEDAVARAAVPLAIGDADDEPVTHRIRHYLNLPEFGAVLGISDSALRKRLRGASTRWFPLEGHDSPLVVCGDPAASKLRFIDIDKLPSSFTRALLSEQRDMIEQLLAVPMGSTRWKGRVMPASWK